MSARSVAALLCAATLAPACGDDLARSSAPPLTSTPTSPTDASSPGSPAPLCSPGQHLHPGRDRHRRRRRRPAARRARPASTSPRTRRSAPTAASTSSTGTTTASASSRPTAACASSPASASSARRRTIRRPTVSTTRPTSRSIRWGRPTSSSSPPGTTAASSAPTWRPATIIDMCGNGKRGFAGNGGPAEVATLDLPVACRLRPRRQPADRRPGEPDDPQGRSHDRRHHDDRRHRPLRRLDQPRILVVLNDGGPATAAGFHFPIGQSASPGGRIALARRRQHLRRGHRQLPPAPHRSGGDDHDLRRQRDMGLRRRRRPGDRRAARPAGRRRGRRRRPRLHRGHRQQLRPRRDARRDHLDVRRPMRRARFLGRRTGSPPLRSSIARTGVEVGRRGEVYVADTHNHRIRVVYR